MLLLTFVLFLVKLERKSAGRTNGFTFRLLPSYFYWRKKVNRKAFGAMKSQQHTQFDLWEFDFYFFLGKMQISPPDVKHILFLQVLLFTFRG